MKPTARELWTLCRATLLVMTVALSLAWPPASSGGGPASPTTDDGWRAVSWPTVWLTPSDLPHPAGPPPMPPGANWTSLARGLELGRFHGDWPSPARDSTIIVLRVDPEHWEPRLFCASESADQSQMTARQWCQRYGLVAATNAGMFATDHQTHVGYLRAGAHINNNHRNSYQSIAAFCPRDRSSAPFRIFDLDATPFETISAGYACIVQNLRLIKRPGENRWSQQPKAWSEAALGEDAAGRILLIFCRSPYAMHDFNEILLSLPLELVCAQHLEGGPEAQLAIQVPGFEQEYVGSYETGFIANDLSRHAWPIPNILGIASPRAATEDGPRARHSKGAAMDGRHEDP